MQTNEIRQDVPALRAADPQNTYIDALEPYPYMMKPKNIAAFLGQSRQAVTGLLRSGAMRGVKSGDCWLVPKKFLIEYLVSNTNAREEGEEDAD